MMYRTPTSRHDDGHFKITLPGLTPEAATALSGIILEGINGRSGEDIEMFGAGVAVAAQLQNFARKS